MLVRCLLPMELDTGPWTRKSSTLCSLLLLTIAAFAVPGQVNSEEVGLGKHTKTGKQVELSSKMEKANETNFNSDDYKKRFPNACDVKIHNGTIELQYNYNSTGCTVDLLSINKNNNNSIKFTAGVRKKRLGLRKCLDEGFNLQNSFYNIMPFVYSKNNKDIEELNKGPINVSDAPCNKKVCKVTGCMPWTFLEISWSKTVDDVLDVYAYTHLVGDVEQGKKLSDRLVDDEMTFEMEIEGGSGFTMDFGGKESFNASKNAVCVRKNNSIVEPETWTITNADLKGERLLVYSLLPLSASFVFDGNKLTSKKPPVGPHCDLFVQFNRTDYDLLFVPLPPPSTPAPTTTTKIPSTRAETSLQTTTISPCPTASTTPMAAVKTTKCPSTETKSGSPVLLILFILVLFGCVITNGIWFYLYKKGKDDKEKQEEEKKAKSIVKSTKGSLYEPDVNTAIQMDVGNAKTASEAVKSTTAGVEADVGSKAGEDNNALNAVATKTLNEV